MDDEAARSRDRIAPPVAALVGCTLGTGASPPFGLYLSDGFLVKAQRMVALDPTTLEDRADGAFDPDVAPWLLSADGSTLVGLEYGPGVRTLRDMARAQDATVVIKDARTSAVRARFRPPVPGWVAAISRDGTRLVLERTVQYMEPPEWHLLTADGQLLQTTRSGEPAWGGRWVEPEARRLYWLLSPGLIHDRPPEPLHLIAYDLEAGVEVGRLELADVRSGVLRAEAPVPERFDPGPALSPDGRRLALVHPDADALTLVDLERLAVVRTVAFDRQRGLRDWLPFWPRPARAKEVAGTERRATFAPDGRRLYVYGYTGTPDGDRVARRGLGLAVIDVATGRVHAEGLAEEQVDYVRPTPDGRTLYAFGPRTPRGNILGEDWPYVLRRLDATTLAVLAERELVGYRRLVLWPGR